MNKRAYAWINHRDYGFPVNLIKPQKAYLSAFPPPLDADTCPAQIYSSDGRPHPATAGPLHLGLREAPFDPIRGVLGRKSAAHSCVAPAGSDVRATAQ